MEGINSLIPTLAGLVGAIIGAVFGGIVPHYLREKSAYKNFRKNKLELLYKDITHWLNDGFSNLVINFHLVFIKEIDWNEYLDKISSETSSDFDYFQIEITINLYFCKLETDFNNITKAFQELNRFINNEIKEAYLASMDISIFKSDFDAKVKNIDFLAEKLKDHIKRMSKEI